MRDLERYKRLMGKKDGTIVKSYAAFLKVGGVCVRLRAYHYSPLGWPVRLIFQLFTRRRGLSRLYPSERFSHLSLRNPERQNSWEEPPKES